MERGDWGRGGNLGPSGGRDGGDSADMCLYIHSPGVTLGLGKGAL